jgi:hypothetical protein
MYSTPPFYVFRREAIGAHTQMELLELSEDRAIGERTSMELSRISIDFI